MKKKYLLLFAVSIIGILIFFGVRSSESVSTIEIPDVQSVKTIRTVLSPFQESREFSGFIRGVKQTDIASSIPGSLLKLTKEEGDNVYQGEIVAVIDGRELSVAERSAASSLQSIEKTLRETKKYYDQKVDEAKTALDNTTGESEKDSAEEALKSAKRLRDAQIATLNTQKEAVAGSLAVSQASASQTLIRAPFAGIITQKNTSLGAYISPGMSLYSIASEDALEVVLSIPTSIATQVKKGSLVSVSNGNTTLDGFVFSISSLSEESSQRSSARIRFANRNQSTAFSLGEYVHVTIPLGETYDTILIPEQALISEYDDTFVFVIEDNQAKKYPVVLGSTGNGTREIITGITPGMHIVIEGQHTLSHNQTVTETYVTE